MARSTTRIPTSFFMHTYPLYKSVLVLVMRIT